MELFFSKLIGTRVKVLFLDNDRTKVIIGTLNEVNDKYIVVDTVVIGLGSNFISCLPYAGEGNHD